MALFEVDAQKVEMLDIHRGNVTDLLYACEFDNVMCLFSHFDLKSVAFLLLGSIDLKMNLIKETREKLYQSIKKNLHKIPRNVLIDILMMMKKFREVKKLNVCKHQLSDFPEHSSNVWKFLYSLCTEVNDEELKTMNTHFFGDADKTESLEETICHLLISSTFHEETLSAAFRKINRTDLIEELLKNRVLLGQLQGHQPGSSKVTSYHIRQPSANDCCGLAVIVNVEKFENFGSGHELSDRRGSNVDRDKLQDLWKSFGFHTEVSNDSTSSEIKELFQNICRNNHDYDIFVACFLSHGRYGIIYGSDRDEVHVSDLIDMVDACTSFSGKPKLFFVQACQEYEERPELSSNHNVKTKDKNGQTGSLKEDIFEAYSTVPGHVSYRHPENGSIFISALVENLSLWGDKEIIESIMKRVNQKVSYSKQMPITHSTLRQNVIFKKMR